MSTLALFLMVLLLVTQVVLSIRVATSLTLLYQEASLEVFQGIRSQLLQVSQVLAKHFSALVWYSIFSNLILMLMLFILSLKVLYLNT